MWHEKSKVTLQWYGRHELLSSDHRPITAIFQVQARKYIEEKRKEVFSQIIKQLDKQENESIPQIELSPPLLEFGEVSYMTPVTRTAKLLNTGGSGVSVSYFISFFFNVQSILGCYCKLLFCSKTSIYNSRIR